MPFTMPKPLRNALAVTCASNCRRSSSHAAACTRKRTFDSGLGLYADRHAGGLPCACRSGAESTPVQREHVFSGKWRCTACPHRSHFREHAVERVTRGRVAHGPDSERRQFLLVFMRQPATTPLSAEIEG